MEKYKPVPYKDLGLRVILCTIAAHIMSHYDERDSFFEAIFTASYIRAFVISFVTAIIVFGYIRYVSMRLDRRYHWKTDTLPRLMLQIALGFMIPTIFTAGTMAVYFAFYNRFDLYTDYIRYDFIVALLMLLLVNVYYFGMSLFYQVNVQEVRNPIPQEEWSTTASTQTADETQNVYREVIIVETAIKSIPIKVTDIAYIYILAGIVYLRTKDMASLHDAYMLSCKLKDLESQLDPRDFYRINRKMIVYIDACSHYRQHSTKTLEVSLTPAPYNDASKMPDEHLRLCIVSEDRVAGFKEWIKRPATYTI